MNEDIDDEDDDKECNAVMRHWELVLERNAAFQAVVH